MGVNNFTLLCIPFFILVGEIMNRGGITVRLVDFTRALIGHFRGGLAYVNILVSAFLSAITGMANAVAVITTTAIIPEMRKDGYKLDYCAAVSTAASIMGPIIPPSLIFIIYAVSVSVSIGDMFIAGIIPGLLLVVAFMVVAHIQTRKMPGLKLEPRQPFKHVIKTTLGALPAMFIPVAVVGGIITGVFTPTEAGAMGTLVAFIVGMFVYRELKWKDIPGVFYNAGKLTAAVLLIASGAALFGWVMAMDMIPQRITEAILACSDNPWILRILVNLIMLAAGMFLEPIVNTLLLAPVLYPVCIETGMHPIQIGVMMGLNLTIGLITPPVGITMYIVSGITKVPFLALARKCIPYLIAAAVVLMLITYVPLFTTILLKN
jgi:tripartite ATP-independent transporter DctM subunit